jgi:hypothetical protein
MSVISYRSAPRRLEFDSQRIVTLCTGLESLLYSGILVYPSIL